MRFKRATVRTGVALGAILPLVTSALAFGMPAVPAAPADGDKDAREALQGTTPQWATARADQGATADDTTVHARVYLAGRDPAGLTAYARAVSDPHSPSYRDFLSAKEAKERFDATGDQVDAVRSWLTGAGLSITGTTRHYISVTGGVSAAEHAFATQLHDYRKGDRTYRAPEHTATVPASLNGAVLTVTGLDDAPHVMSHKDVLPPPPPVSRDSGPFSTFHGSNIASDLPEVDGRKIPYAVQGYTGTQLRGAYAAGGMTGKGVTVAITDAYASPTIADDAATYADRNGDAPYGSGQLSQVVPGAFERTDACGASGWYTEETLDIEAVHALAPEANIVYAGASSCATVDLLNALSTVVDGRLADIVSNSWGTLESFTSSGLAAAFDQVFQRGAVEGIGFYFSSGDFGDEEAFSGEKQVDAPANSPWVTAVGGTSLAVGDDNTYQWETGWGTHTAPLSADGQSWAGFPGPFSFGAGGGTSRVVTQPDYQHRAVPDALAQANGATRMRTVPDISAIADPGTGFLIGQTQSFPDGSQQYGELRVGGTSLAAPVIAGVQALAQQAGGGRPIGFANPAIYDRFGTKSMYHDVMDHPLGRNVDLAVAHVSFNNGLDDSAGLTTMVSILGMDTSLTAVKGYDNVTGVGTPASGYLTSYADTVTRHGGH